MEWRLGQIRWRNFKVSLVACVVQFMGVCASALVSYAFICTPLQMIAAPLWVLCLSILCPAIVIWSAVLFKTDMLRWWFIYVNPLTGVVLRGTVGKNGDSKKYRELMPGWNGKWPSEVIADKPINLQANILIGHSSDLKQPLIASAQDNIPLEFDWQTTLSPLQGHLDRHIQYTDLAQVAFFRGDFSQFLQGWAREKLTANEIMLLIRGTEKLKLEKDFNQLHAGKNRIDLVEIERGTFSGDPQFNSIEYGEVYRRALQTKLVMTNIGDGVEVLTAKFASKAYEKDVDPTALTLISAAAAGVIQNVNPILLVGLKGLDPRTLGAARDIIKNSGQQPPK